mmetsp:Transcript_37387/g.99579  ORF Transcript_37387/g.99579 Transcript_37387/m.99579 type:complete len:233 (-) Transcript_37387:1593-2291(-)
MLPGVASQSTREYVMALRVSTDIGTSRSRAFQATPHVRQNLHVRQYEHRVEDCVRAGRRSRSYAATRSSTRAPLPGSSPTAGGPQVPSPRSAVVLCDTSSRSHRRTVVPSGSPAQPRRTSTSTSAGSRTPVHRASPPSRPPRLRHAAATRAAARSCGAEPLSTTDPPAAAPAGSEPSRARPAAPPERVVRESMLLSGVSSHSLGRQTSPSPAVPVRPSPRPPAQVHVSSTGA